jgi:glycosyltransferase involved in cell wall biosynthesis
MLRNQIYFRLKPVLPAPLRRAVRQRLAARIRKRTRDIWPIFPGSERAPTGWGGWPDGRRFAVVLTHDVERQRGLDNCRQLMQLEEEMGFKSTFNFVPEGSYSTPPQLRRELTRKGFEVGVHDLKHDGRLFHSRNSFHKKAAQINSYLKAWNASGFRSGFMLHNLDWLHELDIRYDMSTFDTDPFEPQPEGYHTIFPFWVNSIAARDGHPFSNNGASPGYVELPYTLSQDSTLFLLLREQTPEIWLRKIDWIAAHGGMVLVNIHPDYIDFGGSSRRPNMYPARLVREFLSYLSSRYADEFWNPCAAELAAWYKEWYSSPRAKAEELTPSTIESSVKGRLHGKRVAVLLFSHYPADPRPRRAAEALAAQGATIDLICLQGDRFEPRREVVNGVKVTRIPLKRRRTGKLRYAWQYTAFIASSFGHLAVRSLTRRYDLVHVHNMPDVLVFSALVPKLLRAKVVLDLHDPMPELMQAIFELSSDSAAVRMLKRLEKLSIGFADGVITVSRTFKNLFAARGCPPEKVCIVLNSPDEQIFKFCPPQVRRRQPGDLSTPYMILFHGSLVHRNGFDLAVDALELTVKSVPCAKLVVCGASTPFFEQVMTSAGERNLQNSIEYLGSRNLEQIVEAIKSCDVGIVPNHRNVFSELNTPTRIFECLALGKPVIAPHARGVLDYFGERDLIYFELGNANDLAERIKLAFADPESVEQLVKRGQKVYLKHTWSSERSNLLTALSELLSQAS